MLTNVSERKHLHLSSGKILITGGAGFIGSHIAEALEQRGYHPVILDNLKTGRKINLSGIPHTFIEGGSRETPA